MKRFSFLMLSILILHIPNICGIQNIYNDNPANGDDYHDIQFTDIGGHAMLIYVLGRDYDFDLSATTYDHTTTILKDLVPRQLGDFDYHTLSTIRNIGNITDNNSMVLEARDTAGQTAYGFIYISEGVLEDITPQGQAVIDTFDTFLKPKIDSSNTANNYSTSEIQNPNRTMGLTNKWAYVISFDQPDPYESGYTLAELDYEYVYQNSATDYLEKILDTDRNDELVGFRYYSDLNGEEYTIFIKANN